jgi:hypothetical protein
MSPPGTAAAAAAISSLQRHQNDMTAQYFKYVLFELFF